MCERTLEERLRECELLPAQIESAEAKAQSARDAVAQARERIHALERQRREREVAIQDCEARKAKLQGQSALVKSNDEYRVLLSEIEAQTRRIGELEEEILLLYEETDRAQEQVREIDREQQKLEHSFTAEAEASRKRLAEVQQEIEARGQERATRVQNLPSQARAIYSHVLKRRSTGISEIRAGTCSACHRNIPPETINRTLAGELHSCPACQRILVHPIA